ncbi:MAG: hypothetical protein GXO49_01615 [Chlorobi bacterium]|nr:hypothetical protein [Chlorobiota bacterium]
MKIKIILISIIFFLLSSAFVSLSKFYISGIVYDNKKTPANNVKIELFTKPNGQGEKVISLTSDENGTFKSDKLIDFTNGLYPSVKKGSKTIFMKLPAKTGNCNICHKTNLIHL